jgi:16S rRNA (adenine1518-N6/adenine1519-N6)-dimethyltransferase
LAGVLRKTLPGNVVVLNKDVLGIDPAAVLQEGPPHFPEAIKSYKVVANLPYYITSPVLRHFLEASVRPEKMVIMVQKEVAEAIAAGPGQRSMLSISVQFYGRPASFYPPPEVDSAVVKIDIYDRFPVDVDDADRFFKLVRAGFTAARKQAANSLAQGLGLDRSEVVAWLTGAGIDPRRRAETFTLEEWAELWRRYSGGMG